ncbi:MAG TPA: polymer-forming cytoskeletal protein [Spirochaetia bacterium]|nr:polymer-forming cytoskeletal protein [Spirochaetia bacterium]
MPSKNDTTNCIIGEGSIFDGRFYVNGSIMIEGKFQGDIRTDDQLIVGPTGKVKTDIQARRVTIAGTLIGNISASEEVTLLHTGKVLGNIVTPKLTVEPGVITEGKVTITSGQSEDARKVIEESFGTETEDAFSSIIKEKKREKARDKDTASREDPGK